MANLAAAMASVDEIAKLLERTPMFAGLSPSELEELAKVAVPRSYEASQVVFRERDVERVAELRR